MAPAPALYVAHAAGKRVDDVVAHIARMRRGETHSGDASCIHLIDAAQEIRETPLRHHVSAVCINVLPKQRNLAITLRSQVADLFQDRFRRPALLDAPGSRNHAVRTSLVASVDDVHPRAHRAISPRLRHVLGDKGRLHGDDLVALHRAFDHFSEAIRILRADDGINLRKAAQQARAFLLRDAARHDDGDRLSAPLPRRIRPEDAVDLLLRMVPDGARVHHEHVSRLDSFLLPSRPLLQLLFSGLERREAKRLQLAGHPLAIRIVHLTAHRQHLVAQRQLRSVAVLGAEELPKRQRHVATAFLPPSRSDFRGKPQANVLNLHEMRPQSALDLQHVARLQSGLLHKGVQGFRGHQLPDPLRLQLFFRGRGGQRQPAKAAASLSRGFTGGNGFRKQTKILA
eukprot:scaffold8059_cov315-Pinguiococcus_pyrenoidosus.AAC.1